MRVFLDVGAHEGQTLEEVVKPRYGFDVIHAFEPMPAQFEILQRRFADKAQLHPYGLSDRTGSFPVYGTNDNMGASLYRAKRDIEPEVVTVCDFQRASDFFEVIPAGSVVVMKLNCEGGEIPILTDLLDSGTIHRVDHLLVDFDVRKIPGMEPREHEVTVRLLEAGVEFVLAEDVMHGPTHQARIAAWLESLTVFA